MKSLIKAVECFDSERTTDGFVHCLQGLACCSSNDTTAALVFHDLLTEHGNVLFNTRNVAKVQDIEVKPFPTFVQANVNVPPTPSVPTQAIRQGFQPVKAQIEPEVTHRKVEPRNRLLEPAQKFRSKNTNETPIQEFQTAAAAMGMKKKEDEVDERLKGVEPRLVEIIEREVLMSSTGKTWNDLAGLETAKQALNETIIFPMKYPELFTGLREPPRGVLLFGPPGTGKTMIAKALATESNCTFFNISASSLTSKWVGEGEKLTRALFCVARVHAPSIIFIDEIDSILTKRSENDFEASRRVKTEFLLQFDGVASGAERLLVLGATNRPQDIDEAARRRFQKRIYIPLPDEDTRSELIKILVRETSHILSDEDVAAIVTDTRGYSCADIATLMREAAMVPLREAMASGKILQHQLDPLSYSHVRAALQSVKPSVGTDSLRQYEDWNREFGYAS